MRNFDIAHMLKKVINSSKCNFSLPDQDLIGLAFYDRIFHLPIRWNIQTASKYASSQFSYFIMHYTGPKPWTKENDKDYWRYRQITPWAI